MKSVLTDFYEFHRAICNDALVFVFGAGISNALTGRQYGWREWLLAGIHGLADVSLASALRDDLAGCSSADELIVAAGRVLDETKKDGTYAKWMHTSFETAEITDARLADTLRKLTIFNDVFATTNYDLLLERATGLGTLSYEEPDKAFEMIASGQSDSVLHIHGIYDSVHGIDNIIATRNQYNVILSDKGAQFIQNVLGTRTLIFVGCGKTTEDVNLSQFVAFARKYLKMDRAYYFLFNSSSRIADLPDNIHLVPYGDDYADLPIFLEDVAQIRFQSRMSGVKLIERTAFDRPLSSCDTLLKYHFSQQTIPFCGREREMECLRDFVCGDKAFSWWAITGQAGIGKSRLAFELIRRLPSSWFGFFANCDVCQSDFAQYIPCCNTVVVVDYVAGRERKVSELIDGFVRLFSATHYKLRVVLVERDNHKAAGSWYAMLLQRSRKAELNLLKSAEYSDSFLNLEDMDKSAVEKFISEVCLAWGEPDDPVRNSELYESYKNRFERLRFRPLYLQIFIEAWMENEFHIPKYNDYTALLEDLLGREQTRWLEAVGGNQAVCNAFIRLLVRANISGRLNVDKVPELYRSDWELIQDYITSHAFSGQQRSEMQDSLINSMCQNIDNSHLIIAPQFPDIIKEYMFKYYTDLAFLPEMMKEIWQHAAEPFSVFITRCLMDFEGQEFYRQALNVYETATADVDVLQGRLSLLQSMTVQEGDDPRVFWDIIANEYGFWRAVVVPGEGDDSLRESVASLKVFGLYEVARQIGAWSTYDVSLMIEVIDEMLAVSSGRATEFMKKFLAREITDMLCKANFLDEAQYLREKIDALIGNDPEDEFDASLQMQSYNQRMMQAILSDEWEPAKRILLEMADKCNREQIGPVQILAHSCFNLSYFSFQSGHFEMLEVGDVIVNGAASQYPKDWTIKSRKLGCAAAILQKRYLVDKISADMLSGELGKIEAELSAMQFNGSVSDEPLGMTWGMIKTLRSNIASQQELQGIIHEAEKILERNPRLSEVVCTMISGISALHQKYLHTKVSHEEVELLHRYVEANWDSAVVRNGFFDMLAESEDAGNRRNYMTHDIVRGAVQDARYNPIMGSGIPEVDLGESFFRDVMFPSEPYVRGREKVGRNELCPCGSGKKFKKCCQGKGIYD